MLEIKNGLKKYNSKIVFENLNLKFSNGKIYGLVGENGSGKTVIMKCLCGYTTLNGGEVWQDSTKIRNKNNFIENAGIVIENPKFMEDYTLYENLDIIRELSDNKKDINLDYWIDFYNLKQHKDKKYRSLSLGTKQKMLLIQAFMSNPNTLILDECFNGLDEESANKTRELLKSYINESRLIILTSHIKTDIDSLCNEVIYLSNIN
ncbi:ATP-binding cassette domain-containing protein [Gemella cuniculi]|uniref:ATP-binding cassette domain-containing protein n=1 Tax=Gemella cuniculi TaxID=150240 RepID=UPI00040196DF|nr:ABC transporter ATP-binding protein [Gemella cuniculi]